MPHSSLRSFVSTLLLAVLTLHLAAQAPTANAPAPTSAPTDDPFAVLAAKEPQPPERAGMRIVVQKPDGSPAQDAIVVFTPWRDDACRARRTRRGQPSGSPATSRGASRPKRRTARATASTNAARPGCRGRATCWRSPANSRAPLRRRELGSTSTSCCSPWHRRRSCSVEVVTADGEPAAAVPLARARLEAPDPALPPRRQWPRRHRDVAAADRRGRRPRRVQLAVASATPPGKRGCRPLAERVRLQVPATTSRRGHVRGRAGAGRRARLDACSASATAAPAIAGERTGERSARWPFVERGASFVDHGAEQHGSSWRPTRRPAERPRPRPVALVRSASAATFAMQILDPSRCTPARDCTVSHAVASVRGAATATVTRTNREGWIEVAMPASFLGKKGVELSVELGGDASEREPCTGKVAVQATEHGRSELPPLRCATAPVLAAGTFVTRDGNPVPGFQVTVRSSSLQRLATTASGTFVIRGRGHGHAIQLLLDHDWCAVTGHPWEIALPEGTKDARLVVQRAARVRFATDLRGEFLSRIDYGLEPADGEGAAIDLPFSLEQHELLVPPGHWHFVVSQENEELHRLPDLRAASGVETHDPRFLAFDWRAFAIPVELRVRDAAGQPSDACTVWITSVLGGSGRSPMGGVLRLLLPKRGTDLEIEPDDATLPRLPLGIVTKDQVVVLGGGPALTMRLQPMPNLPEGFELVLATEDRVGVPFDARGLATLRLPKAGEVPPTIRLRRGDGAVAPLPWQLPPVDVPEAGTTLDVELTPDRQTSLDHWIERIRAL
jgi:hypothetical protein